MDLPLRLRAALAKPRGGVYWLILPTVNVELFSIALREFAKEAARTSAYSWWWIGPGGTPAGRSRSPKGYTWSSCPPARLSYSSRRIGCGR